MYAQKTCRRATNEHYLTDRLSYKVDAGEPTANSVYHLRSALPTSMYAQKTC
jgi:hypothetical protein